MDLALLHKSLFHKYYVQVRDLGYVEDWVRIKVVLITHLVGPKKHT